jgi:hypothetical protein
MTTETDIEEICRRLGWIHAPAGEITHEFVAESKDAELYTDPDENAALHMRWLGMLGRFSMVRKSDVEIWLFLHDANGERVYEVCKPDALEAIRAALLAKLRSEQNG